MYVCVPYCESVYNLLEQNHLQKTEINNHQTLLNKITSQDFMEQPEVLSQIHNTNRKCTSMQTISQKCIVCINGMFWGGITLYWTTASKYTSSVNT